MRVAIAGAGAVGRSLAVELVDGGHQVMLIERLPVQFEPEAVRGADWILGDACEMSTLEESGIEHCDVVIAASGDDKVNLVFSLLAKTEFAVERVVARVNDPANEWLFDDSWGVDVAVSTPRLLAAMVEEAITIGDLVPLMSLQQGEAKLVEIRLPADTPLAGKHVRDLKLPRDAALVAILRRARVIVPHRDDMILPDDELLFVAQAAAEDDMRAALAEAGHSSK